VTFDTVRPAAFSARLAGSRAPVHDGWAPVPVVMI